MAKLRIALVLMIIFVSSVSWWKRSHQADVPPASIEGAPGPATAAPAPAPEIQNARPFAEASLVIDAKNQALIRECLAKSTSVPRVNFSDKLTLENVLRDLDARIDSSIMNIHVRRANGREERLHVQPHDSSAKDVLTLGSQDVRVFDVDTEGLPIAKPFPNNLRADSLKHVIDCFIGSDQVTFKERRTHQTFAGGSATVVEADGHLTELQVNFSGKTLGCTWQRSSLSCACL